MKCLGCKKSDVNAWFTFYCSLDCQASSLRYIGVVINIVLIILVFSEPILLLLLIPSLLYTFWGFKAASNIQNRKRRAKKNRKRNFKLKRRKREQLYSSSRTEQKNKTKNQPETKYIPGLDQEYNRCCILSARLSDKYCDVCGRVIESELIEHINTSS